MAESLCILVRKPPYGTIHAAEALRHAGGALKSSLKVTLVMIDDGVYLAKDWQQSADLDWVNLAEAVKRLIAQG
ncbi:MAG: DsrE family protein, partial [Chloroflexota bacterium]